MGRIIYIFCVYIHWVSSLQVLVYCYTRCIINKENRIYIRVEFTRKKCKTAILLYCFHMQVYFTSSKINIKRKPNCKIGWFHNWPMIISHRLYAFHLTNDDFRYNFKSNDVFYSPNSFYKVYLTALKNSKLKWIV